MVSGALDLVLGVPDLVLGVPDLVFGATNDLSGASRLVLGGGSRALFGRGREAELVSNFCRRAQKLGYVGGRLWGALETISFDPSPIILKIQQIMK